MRNLLLQTDVYKFGHKDQYPPGTTKVYSYLEARGSRIPELQHTLFFGLRYYLQEYFHAVTKQEVEEFVEVAESILGPGTINRQQADQLAELGYLPLHIKAVPEGTVIHPLGNALMTITNTHPDFAWLVNYVETLLMKLWSPITVASNSLLFRLMFEKYAKLTCDDNLHVKFQMHDFGYRGVSSEESAAISGASHLLSFMGTDTTAAVRMLKSHYDGQYPIGLSVPASEHSVMCSWSKENDDTEAIHNMLTKYPNGIVSIVSDSYNLWDAIQNSFGGKFRDLVLNRDGKVTVRPDSGNPYDIVCGDPSAPHGTPERKGVIQLLFENFGGSLNKKGYWVLDPRIGCIYGDGIFLERAELILRGLIENGFASSNIVFGSGGLLLNNFSRDTLKMAIKATYCEVDGESRPIEKNPITDVSKKSKRGLLQLSHNSGRYTTLDDVSDLDERYGVLEDVFIDGYLFTEENSLDLIRRRVDRYVESVS